jgi:hypothetical protein
VYINLTDPRDPPYEMSMYEKYEAHKQRESDGKYSAGLEENSLEMEYYFDYIAYDEWRDYRYNLKEELDRLAIEETLTPEHQRMLDDVNEFISVHETNRNRMLDALHLSQDT